MANRKYIDDYEITTQIDENGVDKQITVYRGEYFEVQLEGESFQKFRLFSLILVALIIVFHIGNGVMNVEGMYQFYVVFPYVFAFFPILYMSSAVLRLPKENRLFQRDEIDLSYRRMENWSRILFVLVGLIALGETLFIVFFSDGTTPWLDFLFLGIDLAIVFLTRIFLQFQKKVIIEKHSEK